MVPFRRKTVLLSNIELMVSSVTRKLPQNVEQTTYAPFTGSYVWQSLCSGNKNN